MEKKPFEQDIMYICELKIQEFHLLGYENITPEEIWNCVSEKYKEIPPLHRVVNDILSLKPGRLMNWMTMRAFKGEM
ncbi:ComN-like post-transcriptional regulator [Aneurinibacillus soli]|uniref:Post-transcriptional regulator ComN n=1 Tax=Aneurinibacillus soli TaxID=1500254 RepID=A0A0U5B9Y9_9BACL|nr:post-transcriptional regulator [Aneurinibacillus soli]PYE62468.1 ComN-like post-transcriptional regulator [Aneurinibacillus soli]BAU27031.1 Post-transcriptional regulator ComN [Aneurinibacillus soli]